MAPHTLVHGRNIALGQEKAKSISAHGAYWRDADISTNYNPTDDRCYIRSLKSNQGSLETDMRLFGGQTDALLAYAKHFWKDGAEHFDSLIYDKRYVLPTVPESDKEYADSLLHQQWLARLEKERFF